MAVLCQLQIPSPLVLGEEQITYFNKLYQQGLLKGGHQMQSNHFTCTAVTRHQGLFEEHGSEMVRQGWLLNVYDMSDLTFERASGWHLSLRQARLWHFMYHEELLGGKGERGKFTYRHRQMNIAYWSARCETGRSDPLLVSLWCPAMAASITLSQNAVIFNFHFLFLKVTSTPVVDCISMTSETLTRRFENGRAILIVPIPKRMQPCALNWQSCCL